MVVLRRQNENAPNGIILLASVARASSCYCVNCVSINRVFLLLLLFFWTSYFLDFSGTTSTR